MSRLQSILLGHTAQRLMRFSGGAVLALLVACGAAGTPPAECRADAEYRGKYSPAPELPRFGAAAPPAVLDVESLDAAFLDAFEKTPARQLTAAVAIDDDHAWQRSHAQAGEPAERFYWASVGKAFTAMVILELAEEGRLSLDQPLADFVDDVPQAGIITIRQLLSHTSGLYSFQQDPEFREREGYVAPAELVQVAVEHGPLFCPGVGWDYSNTGYVLLGKIIERIEGVPYHQAVNARLFAGLAPQQLEALAPRAMPSDVAPPEPPPAAEPARHDLTTPFAAGVVVGTSLDMARVWRRFLAGELVQRASVEQMFATLYPMFGTSVQSYGLGVMTYDLAAADPAERDVWLGHSGGRAGAKAVVAWSTQRRVAVAVALTGDGSPEAIALALLRILD